VREREHAALRRGPWLGFAVGCGHARAGWILAIPLHSLHASSNLRLIERMPGVLRAWIADRAVNAQLAMRRGNLALGSAALAALPRLIVLRHSAACADSIADNSASSVL